MNVNGLTSESQLLISELYRWARWP